jgi:hypothetical protein
MIARVRRPAKSSAYLLHKTGSSKSGRDGSLRPSFNAAYDGGFAQISAFIPIFFAAYWVFVQLVLSSCLLSFLSP